MSVLLSQLVREYPNKDERLLAASSLIVRLERDAWVARELLAGCIGGLGSLATTLREPPLPMPKTAETLERLIADIKTTLAKHTVTP